MLDDVHVRAKRITAKNYISSWLIGNNFFGEEIRTFLNSATNSNSYSSYILMDRIFPRISTNCIIKAESSTVRTEKVVSELGIFGVYIRYAAWKFG